MSKEEEIEKIYTLEELKDKLTEKEKNFCHEYVIDWNGSRAAREAGYSEKTSKEIAHSNLTKVHIKQYIDFIKNDYERECGISKIRQLKELAKIAYSSIAHLHLTWIELKDFESLTDDQKECIESTETKIEKKQSYNPETEEKGWIDVKMVKIKLHPKLPAIQEINKMLDYHSAQKLEHSGEIKTNDISKLTTEELINRANAVKKIDE